MDLNRALNLKRDRKDPGTWHQVWDDEEEKMVWHYRSCSRRDIPASLGHVPNKNESRALRRIMSRTGLNAEQVREVPKFRRELAEAAGPQFRAAHDNMKKAAKQLPWYGISDQELRDQVMFAHVNHMDVNASYFPKKWAEEKRRRAEQAILDKLSQPW